MVKAVKIGERWVGDGYPVYIVAEIGINHNGDVEIAKRLIDAAVHAGCDAVKFQKPLLTALQTCLPHLLLALLIVSPTDQYLYDKHAQKNQR